MIDLDNGLAYNTDVYPALVIFYKDRSFCQFDVRYLYTDYTDRLGSLTSLQLELDYTTGKLIDTIRDLLGMAGNDEPIRFLHDE